MEREGQAPDRETPAAFGRRLGVHKSTITRAIQAGRLILGADGLLDIADSLRQWTATQTGSRPDVAARHAAKRGAAKPVATPGPESAPRAPQAAAAPAFLPPPQSDDEPVGSLQHYRKLKLAAENNLVKLGMALRAHKRYPLAAISTEAHSLGATLRGAMERLIDQTAPRLAATTDTANRQHIISQETAKLRHLINREFIHALRRLRAKP